MSWINQLLQTYENNIGKKQKTDIQMTPVAHMNVNAHIELMLNENGEFQFARKIADKEAAVTLIPVTELSAGRSSGIAPHALSDTLSYIAGDFYEYCDNGKKAKSAREKFESFIKKLQEWAESQYATEKVRVIYKYLSQKRLIKDLIEAGIVGLGENGRFDSQKINGQPYEKAIVRFMVIGVERGVAETWKDTILIGAYTKYYLSQQQGRMDLCYATGKKNMVSENHPKGIVASDYGAKIVSANDGQGYTFRGRFQNASQAYALSYEASQKIHSALTWLIKTQGVYVGNQDKRMFICWNPNGKKAPNIFKAFEFDEDEKNSISEDFQKNFQKKLIKTFQGYRKQFDPKDKVIIMGLDAATTGRLSITYYCELAASDFLDRITYWGETCNWLYLKVNMQKTPYYSVETPIFRRIIEYAFGTEKGNFIEADDKVLKEHTQRLVKCMMEKQPVPFDIIQALVIRASTPLAYSRWNRECILSTACALIVKYYYDRGKKGDYDVMKLDIENRDRSYLFGRLLAVYELIERITYDGDEKREPNAIRLQSVYVNHPLQTCRTLESLVNPYLQKLTPGAREYYRKIISQIMDLIQDEDIQKLNQRLKETYLLGYYLQRAELTKKKETSKSKEEKKDE